MPELADERAAFVEALRRAEAEAGITRDAEGNEVYAETSDASPELQGAVPVQASDQPLIPAEPAVEADTSQEQQPVAQAEPQSVEEMQAEIARLQDQLSNKDSFIGRQSTEVGELRQMVDDLRTRVDLAQSTPVAAPPPQVMITQDMIIENPANATQLAYAQAKRAAEANGVTDEASERILTTAFEAWKEEDPFTAGQWLTDERLKRQRDEFQHEIQVTRSQIQTATAPIAKSANEAQWSSAFVEMSQTYPDFLTVDSSTGKTNAQRLLEEVAPQFPTVAKLIAEGDAHAKVEGLTLLYEKSRLGNPEQVQQELQVAAEEAAAQAAATRAAAGVVNGQSSAGQGSEVAKTQEQLEAEAYLQRQGRRPSLARGFTRG